VTRRAQVQFAAVMTIYGGVTFLGIVLLTHRSEVLAPLLTPLTLLTARATVSLLHWLGMEAVRTANVIAHANGFAYQITYGCVGLIPIATLFVAVLAYHSPVRHKFAGIALGVPILIVLNLARLVHLFYIGVYHHTLFSFYHDWLWDNCLIFSTLALWLGWIRWSGARLRIFAGSQQPAIAPSSWF
jgi:exosortase H (IPTLxxWG-CTERM-specific)